MLCVEFAVRRRPIDEREASCNWLAALHHTKSRVIIQSLRVEHL